ncbi:MAG: rhomboid family intramembrane serine protease [Nitrosopumilus sp.]|jgi:membrane associated rhomboid family serine protease|nr:rhomboid family intramembrane serine protease [Nitrosopumilus sp.]
MFPLRDENPHPPGFKPYVTYSLIAINVLVFFIEVVYTGQLIEFTNQNSFSLLYNWGAVPNCVTGGSVLNVDFGAGPLNVSCPDSPYVSLLSSIFLHGGAMHLGGNMLFLWIFGDNIELKFGRMKYLGIYLLWGIIAGLTHIFGDPTSAIPAVGASGAISGVLGAYLVMFPKARIQTAMMMGFMMRMMYIQARWFLPFWFVFQNLLPLFIGGFGVAGGGVAYLAHIGGFIAGLATGYLYKKTHSSEFTYGTRYGYKA